MSSLGRAESSRLRVKMLLDGEKPKVSPNELKAIVERAGLQVTTGKGDVGIVVGGDGIFSRCGRAESIPLLFVGVRSNRATGSKAYLAATSLDGLLEVLRDIREGRFSVREHKRLEVRRNGRTLGEVFTDVYLQRGAESNCIRYRIKVSGSGTDIDEVAIGDGVVVSTPAGSTGYYSYPDKIKDDRLEAKGHASIRDGEVGICHVVPTYTERLGSGEHPLRYTVPWGSRIELSITRTADARLYGVGAGRGGIPVTTRDRISVLPSGNTTKVISLHSVQKLGQ